MFPGKCAKIPTFFSLNNLEKWNQLIFIKFALVEYQDKKGELRPCYQLTKIECLYIATKFNDEARARLVLRWQELESEKLRVKSEKWKIKH